MDSSFTQWRDSPSHRYKSESLIISDSEDETVDNSINVGSVIDESDKNSIDVSDIITPTKHQTSYSEAATLLKENVKHLFENNSMISSDSDNSVSNYKSQTSYSETAARLKKSVKRLFEKNGMISSDSDDDVSEYKSQNNDNKYDTYDSDNDSLKNYTEESLVISSPIKTKDKKRKDVTHDNTREDIKELKLSSCSDSLSDTESPQNQNEQTNSTSCKILDLKDKSDAVVICDSDPDSEENSKNALAISLAKKEIDDVKMIDVDPLIAQKRAITVCKLQQLQNQLAVTKQLLAKGNIEVLPDKGKKLRDNVYKQEKEIQKLTLELENTHFMQNPKIEKTVTMKNPDSMKKEPLFIKSESSSYQSDYSYLNINDVPSMSENFKELGKKAQETRNKELALTVERLQDLHGSLVARPSEDEKAEDPRGLKVPLMPHQQHALAWLLWREQQKPPGGVLADDMGLGKTLTMISLIMTTLSKNDTFRGSDDSDDSDNEWDKRLPSYKGGTLVICPASLLSQWEKEVRDKCKRGLLSIQVYHGSNRENIPRRLAKIDIVITTYNIAAREYKSNSTLYKIHWKRVILDEAHIVRNHKSQASQAVCGLMANKRWALTGTPIQNKEVDLYSILKFLKCSPFDDLRVWKRWVDNKNVAGQQRLATVMKTLMLRRTKQELQTRGHLESLPEKFIEEVAVKLDSQEELVYKKILIYSRTLFAQFLAQRAEKDHMVDLYSGKYNQPTYLSNPNKETQFTKAQSKLLALHADVKSHEILVLLLRLRQICCHPALIHAMLDQEDIKESGIMNVDNMNPDLVRRMSNISLNRAGYSNDSYSEEEDAGVDRRIAENLLTIENPVFENDRVSSKMRALLDMVKKILEKDDKLIIVSQWASMLDIVALNLRSIKGATFAMFTGSVAIKDRQGIMDSFNIPNSDPKILLLSLTAGGVGLNLVGANHLLLFDIHWNPQLETQAQDRIYRFGQKKNVYIYKFICSDTIEERIKALQERKLDIAQNVLTGDKNKEVSKLTFNDLKSLFAF